MRPPLQPLSHVVLSVMSHCEKEIEEKVITGKVKEKPHLKNESG